MSKAVAQYHYFHFRDHPRDRECTLHRCIMRATFSYDCYGLSVAKKSCDALGALVYLAGRMDIVATKSSWNKSCI